MSSVIEFPKLSDVEEGPVSRPVPPPAAARVPERWEVEGPDTVLELPDLPEIEDKPRFSGAALAPRPAPAASRAPRAAARPPSREGLSALSMGLGVAVLVLGLFTLFNWSRGRKSEPPVAPVLPSAPLLSPTPAPPLAPVEPLAAAAPVGAVALPAPGAVPATDGLPGPVAPAAAPVPPAIDPLIADGNGVTLYRCKGAGDFWSRVHCQHRGALVTRSYTVPAQFALVDQIAYASQRMGDLRPAASASPALGAEVLPAERARQCKWLRAQVAALDAYTRQPLTPGEQDTIRRERRSAQNEQFRWRC